METKTEIGRREQRLIIFNVLSLFMASVQLRFALPYKNQTLQKEQLFAACFEVTVYTFRSWWLKLYYCNQWQTMQKKL